MRTTTDETLTGQPQDHLRLLPLYIRAKRRATRQALIIACVRLLLLVCLLLLWQSVSGRLVNPLFISSPLAVASQLLAWLLDGTLWFHTSITLEEMALGLAYGLFSGILAGVLLGLLQTVARILDPLLLALYSIPKIALAPLFILWFGIDASMKVIFVAITVFFLVFLSTQAGVRDVDQDLLNAVRLMGGHRRDVILKVILPAATGSILMGIRIAIPYALIAAVIAELIASNRGLGYLIEASATSFDTAGVFAALVVLTGMAGLLNAVVTLIDRKTSHWKVGRHLAGRVSP